MDGDTVIVQLFEPAKWTEYANINVVVGKTSTGQGSNILTQNGGGIGYTNETAIETRIIDQEILGGNNDH